MGYTTYSSVTRDAHLSTVYTSKGVSDFHTASTRELFRSKSINSAMDPCGVGVRESRDSEAHPNSLAIIIALDLTGSMGSVPTYLVKEGLPHIVQSIIDGGYPDPQILFIGVGDHECDQAPLQIGQFESGDAELDYWLTNVYLEGGGGGNDGESYHLAWYFAARHTSTDCFEKRGRKGYLFTIGDEECLNNLPEHVLKALMGTACEQYQSYKSSELLEMASERYHVNHINVRETRSGSRPVTTAYWKQLMSDGLIQAEHHTDIADIIAQTVLSGERGLGGGSRGMASSKSPKPSVTEPEEIL